MLELAPGSPGDEITATITTCHLPALPFHYNHELHLSQLTAIHEYLSTATNTGPEVQIEELLRWERLCAELTEHYMITFKYDKNMLRVKQMRMSFIDLLQRHQSKFCDPYEVDAMQALINRLESMFPKLGESDTWKLDPPPPSRGYQAISYCCGDQTILEVISLNNVRVQIPASAARALRGMRQPDWTAPVWIDAVCIDSSDPRERAHQVLLMSQIYSSAIRTLVYLDSEGQVADSLLLASTSDWEQLLEATDWEQHLGDTIPTESKPDLLAIIRDDPQTPEAWRKSGQRLFKSLLVYLRQPWFSRLWVHQEVLLSQHVHAQVGPQKIPWIFIQMAVQHYERLAPAVELWQEVDVSVLGPAAPWCLQRRHKNVLDTTRKEYLSEYAPPSLTQLLLETVPLKCLDPLDKVYALLGLTSWATRRKTFPPELKPDYSLPVAKCMRNATLAAIGEGMSLECLTLPAWTKRTPSWVVPWQELDLSRNQHPHGNVADYVARYSRMPDCSQGRKVNMDILRQPNKADSLLLEGCRMGEISLVSEIIDPQDVEGLPLETKLGRLTQSVKDLLGKFGAGGLPGLSHFLMMALWGREVMMKVPIIRDGSVQELVTALPGNIHVKYPHHEASETHFEGERLQGLLDRLLTESLTHHDHGSPPAAPSSQWSPLSTSALDWFISNLRFFLTTRGTPSDAGSTAFALGYGTIDMEPGDQIAMLHGSRLPVVLRPEESWWRWVGPAFTFAHGETPFAFLLPSFGYEYEVEVFEVR